MREKKFYDDTGDYETFYPVMSQEATKRIVNNLLLSSKTEITKVSKPQIKEIGIEPLWLDTIRNCPNCNKELDMDNGWPVCSCSTDRTQREALRKEVFCLAGYVPSTSYEPIPSYDNTVYRDIKGKAVIIESVKDNGDTYIWRKLDQDYRLEIMRVKQKKGTRFMLQEFDNEVDAWMMLNFWAKTTETGGLVDIRPKEAFVKNPIAELPYYIAINKDEVEQYKDKPYVYAFSDTMWTREVILKLRKERPGLKASPTMAKRIEALESTIQGPKCRRYGVGGWNKEKQAAIVAYLEEHPSASIREIKRELHMDYSTIKQALSAIGFYC